MFNTAKEGLANSNVASSNPNLKFNFPEWANDDIKRASWIIRNNVRGYFIGHAHLDHVAGLVHFSPEDFNITSANYERSTFTTTKSIVGLESTLHTIENHLFNDLVWPNLVKYTKQYQYIPVNSNSEYSQKELKINTDHVIFDSVKVFKTCHDRINSTAWLFSVPEAQVMLLIANTVN